MEPRRLADDCHAPVRRPTRFILGCGTGRCGTVSLAHLLSLQPDTVATHESMRLPWVFDAGACAAYVRMLRTRQAGVVVDVGFYLLPYLAQLRAALPGLKVICLERDRGEVIASYLRKTPARNHWTSLDSPHRGPEREDPVWDPCYPHFDAPKPAAIGRYWDLYARSIRALEGDAVRLVPTADLNDPTEVRALLRFAGYPDAEQVPVTRIHLNRTEEAPT